MSTLNLDLFVRGASDLERAQYEILSGLQVVRRAFSQNEIYPHLSQLVHLFQSLRTILDQSDDIRKAKPGRIAGVDLEKRRVVYDERPIDDEHMAAVEELIHWALPHIEAAIEEGTTIFEFVEDHLKMEEVGVVPSYVQEGYLIVPDARKGMTHVLRYQMSIFSGPDDRYRTLRTSHVKSIPHAQISPAPRVVKMELVSEHRDLPNPATFAFASSIGFPFEPTMLPVAKRKLMRHLSQPAGD